MVHSVVNNVCVTQLYRVVSICIGSPPETVTWEYYDKDKQYHKVGPLTPLEFYEQFVQPHFNISDKVIVMLMSLSLNLLSGSVFSVDCLISMHS